MTCSLVLTAEPPFLSCRIEVVEKSSGWPVPLVELRTTHHVRFVTDNAGVIAFDLPELMGRETWFEIAGNGYTVPRDGFGNRGVRLTPQPGKTLRIELERHIVARRLGRMTGAGIFAEAQRLANDETWRDGATLGCDSVQMARHRGRLYWFWGDTVVARYPLGIFDSTGATTPLHPIPSFIPPIRLRYDHFADENGAPRGVAKIPGEGPTWLTALVSLPDSNGLHRLGATYAKVKPPLDVYEWGLCVWDEQSARFQHLHTVWSKSTGHTQAPSESSQTSEGRVVRVLPKPPPFPEGHATFWKDDDGRQWVLFGNPFPKLRCLATFEAWKDPARWQVLDPPKPRRNELPESSPRSDELHEPSLRRDELHESFALEAATDGQRVKPHSGSIAWNNFRKRWVTVFMESFGKPSVFGELWYAEARHPTGPWGKAVKILSHENYTFYNPRLHPELTPTDADFLVFEGTYTTQFADKPIATPRYDYNQILYRLDLDDPRLAPAR